MESALYGIFALIVFVSENLWVNTVRAHFPWSNIYIFIFPVCLNIAHTINANSQAKLFMHQISIYKQQVRLF